MGKYIEIDFNSVEGYSVLSDATKKTFEQTYKAHNSIIGLDYKEDYQPVRVLEHRDFLEVHFKNANWLHYLPDLTWY